jgi:hypothetical protein
MKSIHGRLAVVADSLAPAAGAAAQSIVIYEDPTAMRRRMCDRRSGFGQRRRAPGIKSIA